MSLPVRPSSSIFAKWTAIFSLLLSNALVLTHHHANDDCCSVTHSHASHTHSDVAPISGLESLPQGDCECTDCDTPVHEHSHSPSEDHDHDTCSICRMVYEQAVETIEFTVAQCDERSFDFIPPTVQALKLDIVSGYLTRGPPAPAA